MSLVQEYMESLAALSGNDFQAEVCARLQAVILSFQTIPAKPHGDAGLDAFSHDGKRGYCCYGLEHDGFANSKERETALSKKFKSDLRRLLELDFKGKKLIHAESPEMRTILPNGRRLEHIQLIANWFESHRVLNPVMTALNEYKQASKCRYVNSDASAIIVGPKQLAERFAVDEITILRARQRVLIKAVKEAAQALTINDPKDFDSKMTVLREIRPDRTSAIQALAEQFRVNWRMAIAFDKHLDETVPTLHKTLEESRSRILAKVAALMLASTEPWTELGQAGEIAEKILEQAFGKQFGELICDVSSGEIARLIGECPIGWEAPSPQHGKV
jgi:hypothetical protein